jgi:phosphoribosylformylglycinamidine cyclo-ligase
MVTGRDIRPGDAVIGLPSTGPHSNGYSLIRAALNDDPVSLGRPAPWGGGTVGEALLAPTAIYVRTVLPLVETGAVRGLAHVTGGGITGNLPRVFPEGMGAVIEPGSWPVPPVFELIREAGNVDQDEMRRVFNLGLGYLMVIERGREGEILAALSAAGETGYLVGRVEAGPRSVRYA